MACLLFLFMCSWLKLVSIFPQQMFKGPFNKSDSPEATRQVIPLEEEAIAHKTQDEEG